MTVLTSAQINSAVDKMLDMFRALSATAREQNLILNFEVTGPVVRYPTRFFNSSQTYRLDNLVGMVMIAAVQEKEFKVAITKRGDENFLQPFVEFNGTEPKIDDVFISLNESLDKFIADNPIDDHKCSWRYAPEPNINADRNSEPYALLSNLYVNGAYTDIQFTKEFLYFYWFLTGGDCYAVKVRVREGGTESYSHIGLPNEFHSGYYAAMKEIYDRTKEVMLTDDFKNQYSVKAVAQVKNVQ